jgi:hypothetical protein
MSNAASNYLEDKLLDHTLRNTAFTQPSALYVALFHGTAAGVLTNLEAGTLTDEVTLGNYSRQTVTFSAASSGATSNSSTVTFPVATANYDAAVTCVAVMDASSSGNVLFYGELTTSKTVTTGDTFQIAGGNLQISLT